MPVPPTQTLPPPAVVRPGGSGPLHAVGQGLAVLAITAGLVAGLLEIALRLFAPQIVPPLSGLFVADPDTAYRLKPDARVPYRFPEGNTVFAINSQGLREDRTVGPPAASTMRVLCLGDSFAFGMGVDAAQAYPHLLNGSTAANGTPVESVNAGVFGYGTDNEAAWLRKYGWPLQPRVVLLGFFVGNDVKDNMLGLDKTTVNAQGQLMAPPASRPASAGAGAAADAGETGTPAAGGGLRAWLETHSHAFVFLRGLYYNLFPPRVTVRKPTTFDAADFLLKAEPPDVAAGWARTTGLLDTLRADVQAHGARLVLVAIPAREQVQDTSWQEMKTQFGLREADLQRDRPEQHLAAWSARTGTPLIDLLPAFRAAGARTPLYFQTDRHWNAAGHALAARQIRAGLLQP